MNFPSLSIVIATYNAQRTLENCLRSIRTQDYPQKKIEIILVDAGSGDQTVSIGRKYHCRVIQKKDVFSEAAKAHGLKKAEGEYIADFGSDNILPEKNWLNKIMAPFEDNKDIIASYPLYYEYRKDDKVFNRYVALFGVNDPVPFYLGKADKQSHLYDGYKLSGDAKDCGNYYEVNFTPENLPTVGANGFIIKKSILKKAQVTPDKYFHIDVVYDLVCLGYIRFAVVKTSITHDTADTLFYLLKKRSHYFSSLYLQKFDKRRYHIVTRKGYGKLLLFIFFSLTLIEPLYISFTGYRRKPDYAWFLHPLFCFLIIVVYAQSIIFYLLQKLKNTILIGSVKMR